MSLATSEAPAAPFDEETPHILVVDDDRRIRELLKKYLSENGYRISTAESASEARARMEGIAFDLLVLDVMMPGETGLELTKSLRLDSSIPILLLTARAETEHRIEGFEGGADDYLPKPFEPRELLLRIGTILRRTVPEKTDTSQVRLGACRFDRERGELWRDGNLVRLTDREIQMMHLFASRPNETLSRTLLRNDEAGTERAIDVQINRLRRKIEKDPKNPIYLQTIRGLGYVLKPD
ncbi:response regulator transcription factor [Parvibaculaceae bacterium PLY_AMNH_Bact1]|nr:response regulator transcription factor [Parvibaculaceae bacterium PLY_AMNH_Bact1]